MAQPAALGRFVEIPREAMTAEQRQVVNAFLERRPTVPAPYRIFVSSPAFAERLKALSDYLLRNGSLSQREVEICVLVTARKTSSAYVMAAHRRIAAEAGVPADAIAAIACGANATLSDPREQAVHDVSAAMFDGKATDALFDRATASLGADGVCEIAGIMGFYCTCAFTLGFFDVKPGSR